jgi:molybdopterin molybdotransferase
MLKLLHPDEAIRIIAEEAKRAFPTPRLERVAIAAAAGRALVDPVVSPIDHPPFDKSAMDGFAYAERSADDLYEVIDSVAAGQRSAAAVSSGTAIRIMTGAPIPEGAVGVQRVEWTEPAGRGASGAELVHFRLREKNDNIIRRGENLKAGEALLAPRILEPQDIGILAAAGIAEVEVAVRPRVGIVSTGDEIEPAGNSLGAASIYDSNGPQLAAQAAAAGCEANFYGIARDRAEELAAVFERALAENDIVLVSGGVSMGDFDLVPAALANLGVNVVFHSLAMKPGKPTFFGMRGKTAVFGLPGNPVSTFVNFEVLVKRYLFAMIGLAWEPETLRVRLGAPLSRKLADRVEFLPARLSRGEGCMVAEPLAYHGSSMITVLAQADALLRMEIGEYEMGEGAVVDARRIRA